MKPSKRHSDILRILRDEGTVTISSLAARLEVSLETIRRDVQPLALQGLLVKMHGAISLPDRLGEEPFDRRMREMAEEKRAIAQRMARLISDGDSLMMDTGTTTSFIARALLDKRDLTVVTNSADIARTLSTVNGNTVFMAGGQLRGDNGAAFGPSATDFIRNFKVRHAIITIGGIDPDTGMTDYDLAEAEFAREVLRRGSNRIIVTDHTKFMRSALVKVCDLADIDLLVTDKAPPQELLDAFEAANVTVILPET
ncbi:DeoR/GlpR family DNA-binding transcription regulator [Oryzibacter oryziterrae]|uniref:DeoR/GlpR family DNA-binding transcription regulator n=1 Tax=Oryzibacter oryziterrae TaxID=2766474 RepID=UPI001F4924C0|nr:DeoR/GlpR family DNA-binding transcription regulator [Oryzibacter oryziterrae]